LSVGDGRSEAGIVRKRAEIGRSGWWQVRHRWRDSARVIDVYRALWRAQTSIRHRVSLLFAIPQYQVLSQSQGYGELEDSFGLSRAIACRDAPVELVFRNRRPRPLSRVALFLRRFRSVSGHSTAKESRVCEVPTTMPAWIAKVLASGPPEFLRLEGRCTARMFEAWQRSVRPRCGLTQPDRRQEQLRGWVLSCQLTERDRLTPCALS